MLWRRLVQPVQLNAVVEEGEEGIQRLLRQRPQNLHSLPFTLRSCSDQQIGPSNEPVATLTLRQTRDTTNRSQIFCQK